MNMTKMTPLYAAITLLALSSRGAIAENPNHDAQRELDDTTSLQKIIVIGDWGADLSHPHAVATQKSVADGIASVLASSNHNNDPFVLSVGDNFYPAGVAGSDAEVATRFARTFEDVYNHDAFKSVPWYIIAGNRDYDGDVGAQLLYGQSSGTESSSRWVFPDYFHEIAREVRVPNGGDTTIKVEIIAIDTMQLVDFGEDFSEMETNERALGHSEKIDENGMKWIEHRLSNSNADYLLVAGHYHVYGADKKGPVHGLEKLLRKYHVSAYVSGHIHCQEHIERDGIDYFISGTGMEITCKGGDFDQLTTGNGVNFLLTDHVNPTGAKGGFLSFDLKVDKMLARFHDEAGSTLYETLILPRK